MGGSPQGSALPRRNRMAGRRPALPRDLTGAWQCLVPPRSDRPSLPGPSPPWTTGLRKRPPVSSWPAPSPSAQTLDLRSARGPMDHPTRARIEPWIAWHPPSPRPAQGGKRQQQAGRAQGMALLRMGRASLALAPAIAMSHPSRLPHVVHLRLNTAPDTAVIADRLAQPARAVPQGLHSRFPAPHPRRLRTASGRCRHRRGQAPQRRAGAARAGGSRRHRAVRDGRALRRARDRLGHAVGPPARRNALPARGPTAHRRLGSAGARGGRPVTGPGRLIVRPSLTAQHRPRAGLAETPRCAPSPAVRPRCPG